MVKYRKEQVKVTKKSESIEYEEAELAAIDLAASNKIKKNT